MPSTELKLTLPAALAEEARSVGLLEPEVLAALLREALRQRREDQLFAAADRLAAGNGTALTPAEIEAEIQSARAARRRT